MVCLSKQVLIFNEKAHFAIISQIRLIRHLMNPSVLKDFITQTQAQIAELWRSL